MELKVRITKADIAKGCKTEAFGNTDNCPGALAINRALYKVGLGRFQASVSEHVGFRRVKKNGYLGKELATVASPTTLTDFISAFDKTEDASKKQQRATKGTSFTLQVPERVLKLAGKKGK